jgi:hypothetical protein
MPGNSMLRHQLTGSGAGTPKVEGVGGAVKKAYKDTAKYAVEKVIGAVDLPFKAVEAGRKMARKREESGQPRHRPVRDERRRARETILPGPPGESMGGDKIYRTPKKAPE